MRGGEGDTVRGQRRGNLFFRPTITFFAVRGYEIINNYS